MCLRFRMPATKVQERAQSVSYDEVERAIALALGVEDRARRAPGWLRGRIQHARKLDFGPKSGRGQVVDYSDGEWATKWLIALELGILAASPMTVVNFIRKNWTRHRDLSEAREAVYRNEGSLTDLVDVARAAKRATENIMLTVTYGDPSRIPEIGYFWANEKAAVGFASWLCDPHDGKPRRAAVVPLSTRLCALDHALVQVASGDLDRPRAPKDPLARAISRAARRARGEE
jgi:hypothetical protein